MIGVGWMDEETDDFLAHFGVKGMKWGKRNAESIQRESRPPSRAKVTYDNAVKKTKTAVKTAAVAGGSVALISGAHYVAKNGPEVFGTIKLGVMYAKQNSAKTRAGAKIAGKMLGSMGKNLPYAKIAKGAYKVTSLR